MIRIFETAAGSQNIKMVYQGEIAPISEAFTGNSIDLSVGRPLHALKGFGGALNESGAYLLSKLEPDDRNAALKRLFSKEGAGFTILGLPLGHTDYSLSCFSYNDTQEDKIMEHFTIDRDREYLIPIVKEIQQIRPDITLIARPDYPPQWMLDDNRNLRKDCYGAYALYLLKYCLAYRDEGIEINYLSLFNEPFIYTRITAEEIRTLLQLHVIPMFKESDINVKVIPAESYNRIQASQEWPVFLETKDTRDSIGAVAFHGYDWDDNPTWLIRELHDRFPDLEIWQSEVMNLYTRPVSTPGDAELWGKMISRDLIAGTSAWLFWNLFIDPEGGPWNTDPFNTGYPQDGLIVIDPETGSWSPTAKLLYASHFSRFTSPGYLVLETEVHDDNLPFPANGLYWCAINAFGAPDGGEYVLIVTNYGEEAKRINLKLGNSRAPLELKEHCMTSIILTSRSG